MSIHSVLVRITHQPVASRAAAVSDDPWSRIMRGEGVVINGTRPEARSARPA